MKTVVVTSAALLLIGGCAPAGPSNADVAFARRASLAVVKAAPDPALAKVISVAASDDGILGIGCGWVSLGPEDGIVPFRVSADVFHPEDPSKDFVTVPRLNHGDHVDRITATFEKHLVLSDCELSDVLPAAPAGATADERLDRGLATLWTAKAKAEWAIVPAPGQEGYAAVSRRVGGGAIISPVFDTPEQATAWTQGAGGQLARRLNAEGRAKMAAWDACFRKYPKGAPERERCTESR